jgi:L-serine dehydratase
MGPRTAAETFLKRFNDASNYQVTLYGSLAATGKGHLTDKAIKEVFTGRKLQIVWKPEIILPRHPNGLKFEAYDENAVLLGDWTAYSIGGGAVVDDSTKTESVEVYPFSNLNDIIKWCNKNGRSYWEFVQEHEDKDIW